jgi:hypothetical protein
MRYRKQTLINNIFPEGDEVLLFLKIPATIKENADVDPTV